MIQVINRALRILEFLAVAPEEPKLLSDIAEAMGLNAPTAARIIQTLVSNGYAEQIGRKKGYVLGTTAYSLASQGQYRKDIIIKATPLMEQLSLELGESVILAVIRHGRRVVLHEVEPDRQVIARPGCTQNYNPFTSASGRMLLATSPENELNAALRYFPDYEKSWDGVNDSGRLLLELTAIRDSGVALRDAGETVGLAWPILENGIVCAALGIYLPAYRYHGSHQDEVTRKGLLTSEAISNACASVAS